MGKVFLYSRVSTSAQTLEQQERTVYEWLKAHGMEVDEVVSDEGVSGGVSYKERNLGKVLLPMTQEGDVVIVSEISRLGRSMFDLSKLIHTEMKPRKLRLVICNMGIDLRCDKMTAIDELILNNFSFAAQLEKQLISERTLSALAVKRQQGVKFGAANEKYAANFNKKSEQKRKEECMKRGATKNARHMESRDVKALEKILKMVYPEATKGDMASWLWTKIDTKRENRMKVFSLMRNFKEMDESGGLFRRWRLDDSLWCESREAQQKLSGRFAALKKSVMTEHRNNMPYDN